MCFKYVKISYYYELHHFEHVYIISIKLYNVLSETSLPNFDPRNCK